MADNKLSISGKIIAILPMKQGVSKTGKEWASQSYVIEETEGQYPMRTMFDIFGLEKIKEYDLKLNDICTVYFNLACQEYHGNYYNQIRAWSVNKASGEAQHHQGGQSFAKEEKAQQSAPKQETASVSDLPF